jgi:3-(3-hydroxy-phenyl)propionate hydroxylase
MPQVQAQFSYRRHPDQDVPGTEPARHPVIVVGAGPIGLSLAIDLAQRGQRVVVLDDSDRIGDGSRAICFSKRSLEVWDRLGVGERMVEKGVVWKVGKIFLGDAMVYQFDLLPEAGHKMPAFINLQQYYAEAYLVDRVHELSEIDLRWRNKVTDVAQHNDHVVLTIETPDGPYRVAAEFVVACDGARSALRGLVGAEFSGETFEDQFLIADVKMTAEFPTERWFWFDPPFHSGQSALLHRQPDDVWRIDLQLGPDADPTVERRPENVRPRIERMLGHSQFDFEWISIYKFQCRRMQRFLHERVIFAGDAAHQVSPFGARGANSGIQDAENLAWKLAAVLKGEAGPALIESYERERIQAADENIAHSTRSTDFIAPHTPAERNLRNAVLALAPQAPFARRMINSGRLSVATVYDSPLSTPDESEFAGSARLGAPAPDCPVRRRDGADSHLLDNIPGEFTLLTMKNGAVPPLPEGVRHICIGDDIADSEGVFAQRFDATPSAAFLLRPDQHLVARWRHVDVAKVVAARDRALGKRA